MAMAERRVLKTINFDLNKKSLEQYYDKSWRNAYKEIKDFLKENGFEHRQWSGYVSKEKLDTIDMILLSEKLRKTFPWLEKCASRFDVANVGKNFDVLKTFKEWDAREQSRQKEIGGVENKVSSKPSINMAAWQQAMKTQGDIAHTTENPVRVAGKPLEREE